MKKTLLLGAFLVAGIVSAKTTDSKISNTQKRAEVIIANDSKVNSFSPMIFRIEYGFGAVETADGTCFVYGTYIYGDNGSSMFIPGGIATQSTYVINCTGSGSGMA